LNTAFLHQCALALADRDSDHAQEDNGIGFSANDSAFGHRLANSDPTAWTEQIATDAWYTLIRYKRQLLSIGLDIESVPAPSAERSANRRTGMKLISVADGQFVISFPYDPALVATVKAINGRRFNPETKTWTAPLSSAPDIRALCATQGFSASDSATDAMNGEVPAEAHTAPLKGTLGITNGRLALKFPYDPDAVRDIKAINGRRWDAEEKVWLVPISSVRLVWEFCDKYQIDRSKFDSLPDSDPVVEPDISIDDRGFIIRFPYDRDLVQQVRDLPTASFDKLLGAWRVSRSAGIEVADFAEQTSATITEPVGDILGEAKRQLERISKSRATDAELVIPTLNGTLLPFQRAGVVYTLEALGYAQQPDGKWSKQNA
jgi:hypothetical protein